MSELLSKLKKNSTIKDTDILSGSKFFTKKDMIPTTVPAINIALSGKINGGLTPGLTVWAGPSKHFKTSFSLLMAKAYMDKYSDAVMLFYDSEFGTPQSYFESFGIDQDRVLHTPITDIEQLKFDVMAQLNNINRGDRVIVVIDSVGNLASKKEVEDALNEKSVADMTRAKQLKSLFRMVTPHLNLKDIPMIVVNHTYMEQGMFPKAVVSGGCLDQGTKILTVDGPKEIQNITVGELVHTLDGEKMVTHVWNYETLEFGEPECYEIEFEDSHTVTVSNQHPFLTSTGWVDAEDLVVGTEVLKLEECTGLRVKSVKAVGKKKVYDISVADSHHYLLENGVVSHNTGIYYSADNIFIIGRQQEKSGTDIVGYNFIINVEKSRYIKEKSKIPVEVTWEDGISKWSGLLDMALESGHVIKPKMGWYQKVDRETGEVLDKNYREKDTYNFTFWHPILSSPSFNKFIEDKYCIGSSAMVSDEQVLTDLDDELEDMNDE